MNEGQSKVGFVKHKQSSGLGGVLECFIQDGGCRRSKTFDPFVCVEGLPSQS